MKELFGVDQKVVIVTGAGRGNGLAIAKGFVKRNARVVRVDKHFEGSIGALDLEYDLTKPGIVELIHEIVFDKYKKIDGLVNNAGVSLSSARPYLDEEYFSSTLNINLKVAYNLCGVIAPSMQASGGGSIVNITSLGAELGFPDNPAYQVSKSGLRQLTKAVARDFGGYGVRANNICPGYIKTQMTKASFEARNKRKIRENMTFLGRWGESAELVAPTIFLISDAASYITGTDIYVDGGWTANSGI